MRLIFSLFHGHLNILCCAVLLVSLLYGQRVLENHGNVRQ